MATQNIFDLADLWDNGGTTFSGIKLDVTNTGHAAASRLIDLQIGSSSIFSVNDVGSIFMSGTSTLTATVLGANVLASSLTSVGTLATLTVDDITLNANAITSAGASSMTVVPTAGQSLILDGALDIDGAVMGYTGAFTVTGSLIVDDLTLNAASITGTSAASFTIVPTAGQSLVLDGVLDIDGAIMGYTGAFTVTGSLVTDDITIDGKVITLLGSTGDTATITAGTNGTLAINTVDAAGSDGNITITADGDINLVPAAGDHVLIDGTVNIDAGVVTGITALSSTLIQLGHASDTTLARLAAGKMTIEGNEALTAVTDINAQTDTAHTLLIGEAGHTITMSNASANVLTIPANSAVAFVIGTVINIIMGGAGVTSITGDTGVTLNGTSAGTGAMTTQYQAVSLLKVATNTWFASGDIGTVA